MKLSILSYGNFICEYDIKSKLMPLDSVSKLGLLVSVKFETGI